MPTSRASYLQINSGLSPSKSISLEKQALEAVSNKRYLYIDFQSSSIDLASLDSFLELEKRQEQ